MSMVYVEQFDVVVSDIGVFTVSQLMEYRVMLYLEDVREIPTLEGYDEAFKEEMRGIIEEAEHVGVLKIIELTMVEDVANKEYVVLRRGYYEEKIVVEIRNLRMYMDGIQIPVRSGYVDYVNDVTLYSRSYRYSPSDKGYLWGDWELEDIENRYYIVDVRRGKFKRITGAGRV